MSRWDWILEEDRGWSALLHPVLLCRVTYSVIPSIDRTQSFGDALSAAAFVTLRNSQSMNIKTYCINLEGRTGLLR